MSRGHYDFEPRSWRAINMGRRIVDDDDGYVPRFRLAPLLFSTRRVAHAGSIHSGEKLGVRSVTSSLRPINGAYLVRNPVENLIFRHLSLLILDTLKMYDNFAIRLISYLSIFIITILCDVIHFRARL